MPQRETRGPRVPLSTRKMLWFGFLAAVGVYGLVGWLLPAPVREPVPGWIGAVAGAVSVGLSLLLPRLVPEASGAGTGTGDLAQWACDESVAVVGFVMRVQGREWSELLVYLAVSGLLLWLHRPRS